MTNLLQSIFGNIENESDRGAVLIAQEIIDDQLTDLLRKSAPSGISLKKLDSLLKYPGVFSSFSAKADVAYFAGLIGNNIYNSIDTFRRIRNSAAHDSKSFSLEPHRTQLVEVYRKLGNFGETPMEDVLRHFAIKLYIEPLADSLLEKFKEEGIDGVEPVFRDRQEIIQHIGSDPKTLRVATDKLAKIELGLAIVFLCGLILASGETSIQSRISKEKQA